LEAMDGVGGIGDSIGITATQFTTTTATTPEATHSITETVSIGAARAATFAAGPMPETGLRTGGILADAAEFTTVQAERPGHSTATTGLLGDTRNLAARAGPDPVPSAATTKAGRPGAIHRAEAQVSVARVPAEHLTAAAVAAGITNPRINRRVVFPGFSAKFTKWRKPYAADEFELRQI
jgi:hypothetical protein